MLQDILKEKRCFKLICGAGNENIAEVEKLVCLYSKAGCNFFDVAANPEIIEAAKRGILQAGEAERYLCVSVGIKGDPHVRKATITKEKCSFCGACKDICPQQAINADFDIDKTRCIGCERCSKTCQHNAIILNDEPKNLSEILPEIIKKGVDCIEFHALSDDENDIFRNWNKLNKLYSGVLSICVDRSKQGNKALVGRVKEMLKYRNPYTTIIQADGAPMSGGKDDFKTTLQTVATAELFQNEQLPVYILLSGGTNSKSCELAKQCSVDINGVAIGSYARKIVKPYLERDDFVENSETFSEALRIAKTLVDRSLKFLN